MKIKQLRYTTHAVTIEQLINNKTLDASEGPYVNHCSKVKCWVMINVDI